jgi:hypothetical protein
VRHFFLYIGFALASVALGQPQAPDETKARPKDLRMECSIDTSSKSVSITIKNRSSKKCAFQYVLSGDSAHLNYDAVVTTPDGDQLPKPKHNDAEKTKQTPVTIIPIRLEHNQEHVEKVSLSDLVEIPDAGGTFRVRIGRGLFSLEDNPLELDPAQMLWCAPIEVTFPATK